MIIEQQLKMLYKYVSNIGKKNEASIVIASDRKSTESGLPVEYYDSDLYINGEIKVERAKRMAAHPMKKAVVVSTDKNIYFIDKKYGDIKLQLNNYFYLGKRTINNKVFVEVKDIGTSEKFVVIVDNLKFNIERILKQM